MEHDENNNFKKQALPAITVAEIFYSALNGIIGYIAVYFFKPLWEKLIKLWKKQ